MRIKLNIGGEIFETTINTLQNSIYFVTLLQEKNNNKNNEDIFIDRSPNLFVHVLNYLRDIRYPFPFEYIYELDFYGISYDTNKLENNNIHNNNNNINNDKIITSIKLIVKQLKQIDIVKISNFLQNCDNNKNEKENSNYTSTTSIYCSAFDIKNNFFD